MRGLCVVFLPWFCFCSSSCCCFGCSLCFFFAHVAFTVLDGDGVGSVVAVLLIALLAVVVVVVAFVIIVAVVVLVSDLVVVLDVVLVVVVDFAGIFVPASKPPFAP